MGTNAQQFCLKWNNHQANMLSVFDRLLSNKSLVDVTIGCEGRQVKAHKVVLSACSPFFENLFTENPCKHPIVILKDIRYADLTALVEFMYKGEVNVIQEQLPTLLKTAEALKIKGLAEVTGDSGKSDDKPHASVTPRPESPGSRRKRQRVRRKSTDSAAGGGGHSDSEESMPKASRTEHDDSSMDGATSLDDGSQASLQHQQTPSKQTSAQDALKDPSIVQSNNAVTVNNSPSSAPAHNNATNSTSNGPNSSSKDADFEPTRLLEASMTTDHGADNSTDLTNSTGPDNNSIVHDGLDIKPIITLEEGATPAGAIVPATTPSLPTGADAISSLFPQGTGATALPGTSYQASPQSHAQLSETDITCPECSYRSPFRSNVNRHYRTQHLSGRRRRGPGRPRRFDDDRLALLSLSASSGYSGGFGSTRTSFRPSRANLARRAAKTSPEARALKRKPRVVRDEDYCMCCDYRPTNRSNLYRHYRRVHKIKGSFDEIMHIVSTMRKDAAASNGEPAASLSARDGSTSIASSSRNHNDNNNDETSAGVPGHQHEGWLAEQSSRQLAPEALGDHRRLADSSSPSRRRRRRQLCFDDGRHESQAIKDNDNEENDDVDETDDFNGHLSGHNDDDDDYYDVDDDYDDDGHDNDGAYNRGEPFVLLQNLENYENGHNDDDGDNDAPSVSVKTEAACDLEEVGGNFAA